MTKNEKEIVADCAENYPPRCADRWFSNIESIDLRKILIEGEYDIALC